MTVFFSNCNSFACKTSNKRDTKMLTVSFLPVRLCIYGAQQVVSHLPNDLRYGSLTLASELRFLEPFENQSEICHLLLEKV